MAKIKLRLLSKDSLLYTLRVFLMPRFFLIQFLSSVALSWAQNEASFLRRGDSSRSGAVLASKDIL